MGETASAPRRGRGVPLWCLLLALVLVPVSGVVALAGVFVAQAVGRSAGAARIDAQVRSVALLEAASVSLDQEIVPSLAVAGLRSPQTLAALGIPRTLLPIGLGVMRSTARQAQGTTDAALRTVLTSARTPADRALARDVVAALVPLRQRVETAPPTTAELTAIYQAYEGLAVELSDAETREADLTADHDVSQATTAAVLDLLQVSALAKAASSELGPYFAALGPADDGAFRAAKGEYEQQSGLMARLLQPPLRDAWERTRVLPSVVSADSGLAQGSADPQGTSGFAWAALVSSNAGRDAAYADLVRTAVGLAQHAVADQRREADAARTRALAVSLGIVAVTAVAGLLLMRFLSRSLRSLARYARRIDEGDLVDVEVGGPREARTVGSALGNAVGTLRRLQDQAQAVAEGDLADPSLAAPLPGRLGEVVHASVQRIVQSVREREELQSALAYQAAHDPLTDLPNRSQAQVLAEAALHRGQRAGTPTGLLFVDLDGFKAVNDSFGHGCGDEVLVTVAQRLRETVRIGDTVARLGGDEFVVLVESASGEADLADLADRLIAAVAAPIATTATGEPVGVGASVGIAIAADAQTDAEALFAQADAAVYRAKQLGRGRFELFDEPLRAQLAERAEVERGLAVAIAEGELRLHYQPVLAAGGCDLVGYEALVRWERPGVGLVPPDRFIPVAEQSRLICDLGRWVLGEATRQAVAWRTAGHPNRAVSVNVSGRHLAEPRVVDDVRDALAASGLAPRHLVVEVTETVVVDNPVALAHLAALRELGVRTSLDDFGTGYTSIGQLGLLPFDSLKIDRSFVASPDPAHRSLVTLMIQVAHNLGLSVVAEGVETPDQLARLQDEGCDFVQGFLFSRPLPAPDVPAFAAA